MLYERHADAFTRALDDVERSGRDSGLNGELGQEHRGHRRLLSRLQTTLLPAQRAKTAIEAPAVGPFHGMMAPTTPIGSLTS